MHIDITARRLQLLGSGYSIIPNKAKEPVVKAWNAPDWTSREMTPERVAEWPLRFPTAESTGVLLRGGLGCIDIDVNDPLAWALLDRISELVPELYLLGPTRFGASEYKVALFFRVEGEDWIRLGSRKYNGHAVEIFGGRLFKSGNISRQFGIDGPHSYNEDGSVAANYQWAEGTLGLASTPLASLPTLTSKQALAILEAFETLAQAAGWEVEATPDVGDGEVVYDIDLTTRFNTNRGGTGIDYDELCDEYALHGEGLRCSADFMPNRGDSGSRDRCWVYHSKMHDCVAVYVYGDCTKHFPAALKPPELKPGETIEDLMPPADSRKEDYFAYLRTHQYIYRYNGLLYPLSAINTTLNKVTIGTKPKKQTKKQIADGEPVEQIDIQIPASLWLDRNRPVRDMSWLPGAGELIADRLPAEGGWVEKPGDMTFNEYRPPRRRAGTPIEAARWIDLVETIYPDHVDHIIAFMAHRIQLPWEKINHGLVLTGSPGIGKDTLLEPLKHGVGPWNFKEIAPRDINSANNDFMKSVVLRVSETRDLGDTDRYKFYEATKTMTAAPPDMTRINLKHIPQYYVPNLTAVIFTTNYPADGLYLPPDDRRHYVCGTELTRSVAWDAYCLEIWKWYEAGGLDDVVTYLEAYDLSGFNIKLPPEKTPAFWRMVDAGRPTEENEIRDAITKAGDPIAITIATLLRHVDPDLADWIKNRANSRNVSRRMDECGYIPVRNVDEQSGRWPIGSKKHTIYGRRDVSTAERYAAASAVKRAGDEAHKQNKGNIIPIIR